MKLANKTQETGRLRALLSRYFNLLAIVVAVIFLISLVNNIYRTFGIKKEVAKTEARLERVRAENAELERRLAEVKSQEYIEKQIRDKLGLAKPGEIVVVMPEAEVLRKLAPPVPEEEEFLPDPTWKKWLHLFTN